MSFNFDKSKLSSELKLRQKEKGTFDSPCMSICDYDKVSNICQTCFLSKDNKRSWKVADIEEKEVIAKVVAARKLDLKGKSDV